MHCLECFNLKWFSSFFIIWVAMVNYLNIHVINWTIVFKIKKMRNDFLLNQSTNSWNIQVHIRLVLIKPFSKAGNRGTEYKTSLLWQSNRKFILYVYFVTKFFNSFPGARILQTSYLLELQSKLPVLRSDSGFNFDLTKLSFKDLALLNATRGGDSNTFESLLDYKTWRWAFLSISRTQFNAVWKFNTKVTDSSTFFPDFLSRSSLEVRFTLSILGLTFSCR